MKFIKTTQVFFCISRSTQQMVCYSIQVCDGVEFHGALIIASAFKYTKRELEQTLHLKR